MSDIYLETCMICKIVVPIENNIFQIYDNTCVQFLEQIKEVSGVDFKGVFEQPWYICLNCYTSLLTAQVFRKSCIESYEVFESNQRPADILNNNEFVEKKVNYTSKACNAIYENETEINANEAAIERTDEAKNVKQVCRICEICGNVFGNKRNFKLHMQRHTNKKPFECEICFNEFYTNSELKCHIRKHTGEKPYKCKYCHRRFSDYGTNKNHERAHTNERPFCCNFCQKSFKNQFMLKNHILIHTGKKNYKCEVCKKDFIYPGHLSTHLKSMFHLRNCKTAELEEKEKDQNI